MRWKLLLAASLAATLLGVGGSFGLGYALSYFDSQPSALATLICAELAPVAACIGVGFFVYRHTARRRKLQACVALLLSLLLAQGALRLLRASLPFKLPAASGSTRSAPARAATPR